MPIAARLAAKSFKIFFTGTFALRAPGKLFLHCTKLMELTTLRDEHKFFLTPPSQPAVKRRKICSGNFPKGDDVERDVNEWQTYRTRFLVRARQLTEPMSFHDPIGLREQCGNAGDYLVESAVGVRRVMPRKFFEDVYVPIEPEASAPAPAPGHPPLVPVLASIAEPKAIAVPSVENKALSPPMHPSH